MVNYTKNGSLNFWELAGKWGDTRVDNRFFDRFICLRTMVNYTKTGSLKFWELAGKWGDTGVDNRGGYMSLISNNCPTLEKNLHFKQKVLGWNSWLPHKIAHPNGKAPWPIAIHHSPQPALHHIFTDFLLVVFVLRLQKHSHQEKSKSADATPINYKDRCFCNKTLLPNEFILEWKAPNQDLLSNTHTVNSTDRKKWYPKFNLTGKGFRSNLCSSNF